MKFKKSDEVIVTTGKDKGKKGKIEKIFASEHKVLLPGLNLFKRHLKKRDDKNPGGIIEFPRPFSVSKVALVCPKCGKPTRIGLKFQGDKKVRVCRKCDSII